MKTGFSRKAFPLIRIETWKSSPMFLEGALAHKDSTGASSIIGAGEVQRLSAGTGISHSEYNRSESDPVHFLQIWIIPDEQRLNPGYEQESFELDKLSAIDRAEVLLFDLA